MQDQMNSGALLAIMASVLTPVFVAFTAAITKLWVDVKASLRSHLACEIRCAKLEARVSSMTAITERCEAHCLSKDKAFDIPPTA